MTSILTRNYIDYETLTGEMNNTDNIFIVSTKLIC